MAKLVPIIVKFDPSAVKAGQNEIKAGWEDVGATGKKVFNAITKTIEKTIDAAKTLKSEMAGINSTPVQATPGNNTAVRNLNTVTARQAVQNIPVAYDPRQIQEFSRVSANLNRIARSNADTQIAQAERTANARVAAERRAADEITRIRQSVEAKGLSIGDIFKGTFAGNLAATGVSNVIGEIKDLATEAKKTSLEVGQMVANISTIKDVNLGETANQLYELSTRVPQSAVQLGEGLYNIFSSVEASQEQAVRLLEDFGKGATAARTNTETFGTAVLGVINAYKLELSDATHVSDVFFNTVKFGVVSGQELASNLGVVTQQAKNAGVNFDELGGLIAGVTKEGGQASQNINNLSNLLQKLPTPEVAKDLKAMQIEATNADGSFRPILSVLTDLKAKLDVLSPAAKAVKIQQLFPDAQARTGLLTVLSQLDFVKNAALENARALGVADDAYKKMSGTASVQLQLLYNSTIALLAKTSEWVTQNQLLGAGIGLLSSVIGVMANNTGTVLLLVTALGGLALAYNAVNAAAGINAVVTWAQGLGGTVFVIQNVVRAMFGLQTAFVTTAEVATATTGGWFALIGVLAAAGVAIYSYTQSSKEVKTADESRIDQLSKIIAATKDDIKFLGDQSVSLKNSADASSRFDSIKKSVAVTDKLTIQNIQDETAQRKALSDVLQTQLNLRQTELTSQAVTAAVASTTKLNEALNAEKELTSLMKERNALLPLATAGTNSYYKEMENGKVRVVDVATELNKLEARIGTVSEASTKSREVLDKQVFVLAQMASEAKLSGLAFLQQNGILETNKSLQKDLADNIDQTNRKIQEQKDKALAAGKAMRDYAGDIQLVKLAQSDVVPTNAGVQSLGTQIGGVLDAAQQTGTNRDETLRQIKPMLDQLNNALKTGSKDAGDYAERLKLIPESVQKALQEIQGYGKYDPFAEMKSSLKETTRMTEAFYLGQKNLSQGQGLMLRKNLEQLLSDPITQLFLATVKKAEGGEVNLMVGGRRVNDLSTHPGNLVPRSQWFQGPKGKSSAGGNYQITKTNWDEIAPILGISDFSPKNQAIVALEVMRRDKFAKKGFEDLLKGNLEGAFRFGTQPWASSKDSTLPGGKKDYVQIAKQLAGSQDFTVDADTARRGEDQRLEDQRTESLRKILTSAGMMPSQEIASRIADLRNRTEQPKTSFTAQSITEEFLANFRNNWNEPLTTATGDVIRDITPVKNVQDQYAEEYRKNLGLGDDQNYFKITDAKGRSEYYDKAIVQELAFGKIVQANVDAQAKARKDAVFNARVEFEVLKQRNVADEANVALLQARNTQIREIGDVERDLIVLRAQNSDDQFNEQRRLLLSKREELSLEQESSKLMDELATLDINREQRVNVALLRESVDLRRESYEIEDRINNFYVNSPMRVENALQRDRLELLQREEDAVISINKSQLELSKSMEVSNNQIRAQVLGHLASQKTLNEGYADGIIGTYEAVASQVDKMFDKINSKTGGFFSFITEPLKAKARSGLSEIAQMALDQFFPGQSLGKDAKTGNPVVDKIAEGNKTLNQIEINTRQSLTPSGGGDGGGTVSIVLNNVMAAGAQAASGGGNFFATAIAAISKGFNLGGKEVARPRVIGENGAAKVSNPNAADSTQSVQIDALSQLAESVKRNVVNTSDAPTPITETGGVSRANTGASGGASGVVGSASGGAASAAAQAAVAGKFSWSNLSSSLASMAPGFGMSLGGGLGGGSMVGSILGMGGGLLAGTLVSGLASGAFTGATSSGIFGAAPGLFGLTGAATFGIGAAIAGVALLTSYIIGKNKQRRADENTRNQLSLDSFAQIDELIKNVHNDRLDGQTALAQANQVRQQYLTTANQLKDSKTRNIAVKDVARVDQRIEILRNESDSQDARKNTAKMWTPAFNTGGVIMGFAGGGQFRSSLPRSFSGLIPGAFDRKDDVHLAVSRGERVIVMTPDQWAIAADDLEPALKKAKVPGFATGGANFTASPSSPKSAGLNIENMNFEFLFSGEDRGDYTDEEIEAILKTPRAQKIMQEMAKAALQKILKAH